MSHSIPIFPRLVFSVLSLAPTAPVMAATATDSLPLRPPQPAPAFRINDVQNKSINLADYRGQKVLLTFYRNVGCPVCNLRFHELEAQAAYFKANGLVVLAVYESTPENMKQYLADDQPYATMIPNPEQDLYARYRIERSGGKMMKGMFHGVIGKASKGKKLFKNAVKQDGNKNTIGADFLIDESGLIQVAHYGKYVGDHLSLAQITAFVTPTHQPVP